MPGPIPQAKIDHILELYKSGVALHDIGKSVGVDFKTADKYIRKSGIPKRTKAEASALVSARTMGRPATRFGAQIPEEVCDLYREGATLRDLERRLRIDRKRLSAFLRGRGVVVDGNRPTDGRLRAALVGSAAAKLAPRNDSARAVTLAHTGGVIGQGELELIDALRAHGFDPIHQLPVGSYNLDVAVNELRVAVEVQRGAWHGATSAKPKRVEYLFDRGWRVIFLRISRHGARTDWAAIANQLVAYLDVLRGNPSASGQYGVLARDGNPSSRIPDYFHNWTRIPGL